MLEIGLVIVTGAFVLLVVIAIPFLLEIRRAAQNITKSFETLNRHLPGILKNVEEAAENVNRASLTIGLNVETLSLSLQRFQGIVAVLGQMETVLGSALRLPVFGSLSTLLAVGKGVRAFLRVFRSHGADLPPGGPSMRRGSRGPGA